MDAHTPLVLSYYVDVEWIRDDHAGLWTGGVSQRFATLEEAWDYGKYLFMKRQDIRTFQVRQSVKPPNSRWVGT